MQMQKKITTKDDGRFLVFYHFPDTATAEEKEVFEGIKGDGEGVHAVDMGTGNSNSSTLNSQPSTLNLEEAHV